MAIKPNFLSVVAAAASLLFAHLAVAGILFDTVRDTRARNGIIVLVQPEDAVCTDAARLNFTVLALDTRPERVAALRRQFQEQDVYPGKTLNRRTQLSPNKRTPWVTLKTDVYTSASTAVHRHSARIQRWRDD